VNLPSKGPSPVFAFFTVVLPRQESPELSYARLYATSGAVVHVFAKGRTQQRTCQRHNLPATAAEETQIHAAALKVERFESNRLDLL